MRSLACLRKRRTSCPGGTSVGATPRAGSSSGRPTSRLRAILVALVRRRSTHGSPGPSAPAWPSTASPDPSGHRSTSRAELSAVCVPATRLHLKALGGHIRVSVLKGMAWHSHIRISTGTEGLDSVLGGGLTPGRIYLLEGAPGWARPRWGCSSCRRARGVGRRASTSRCRRRVRSWLRSCRATAGRSRESIFSSCQRPKRPWVTAGTSPFSIPGRSNWAPRST